MWRTCGVQVAHGWRTSGARVAHGWRTGGARPCGVQGGNVAMWQNVQLAKICCWKIAVVSTLQLNHS